MMSEFKLNALAEQRRNHFDLSPQTFEQALKFSECIANSDLAPKDFRGKPANCLIAMQWGAEIGLKPLQAIQNIAIINGRPALWGDSVLAIVRGSPLCEYVHETDDGRTATCVVKRRGEPEQVRTFSVDDAKSAGLSNKQGPWTQYPKRMRQMRARAFALRDVFPDVLKGLPVAEEVIDMPIDGGDVEVIQNETPQIEQRPAWSDEDWTAKIPVMIRGIQKGKSIDDALAWANGIAEVTKDQEQQLRDALKDVASQTDSEG